MLETTTVWVVARPTPAAPPVVWKPKKQPREVTVRPKLMDLMIEN